MTESSSRGLFIADAEITGDDIERWAIVVGISDYKNKQLTLKYAHQDANDFAALLQTPQGGNFAADKVLKLVNKEATTAAVTRALRSFLKKPARDDVVILYFACHGAPDPDRPANLYLLTYDTDPKDIAGTALPMREIDLALRENLLAERVVVLADTCHSAGLGGGIGRRSSTDNAGAFNTYLQEVSQARGGVALLTSAEASESAQEGAQWGKGHGVFTHYLLQGLQGEADGYGNRAKDGIVTVGELFDYVRANVTRDTNNLQHPAIGTAVFDRNLPLAVTGGETAREQYALGVALATLGTTLNDAARHRGATTQFREAIRLAQLTRSPSIEAEIALGKSLYLSGRSGEAIRTLTATAKRYPSVPPELYFWQGIALAKERDYPAAIRTFSHYLAVAPQADEQRGWLEFYLQWLNENREPHNYGLFIGINEYKMTNISPLKGCVNDVTAVRTLLIERYGFTEADALLLTDQQASRRAVRQAFKNLAKRVTAGDRVIVHFSGHAIAQEKVTPAGQQPAATYLILNDTKEDVSNGMGAQELHQLMNEIPAERKFLILDSHPNADLIELNAREGNYGLLVASDSAENAYEYRFVFRGQFTVMGLLSGVLVQLLEESNPSTLTFGKLIDGVLTRINELRFRQTSLFSGDREEPIFTPDDFTLRHFEFSLRRRFFDIPLATLTKRYRNLRKRITAPFPQAYLSFGLAFIEKGEFTLAVESLRQWVEERQQSNWEDESALLFALYRSGEQAKAGALLQSLYSRQPSFTPANHLEFGQLFFALGIEPSALSAFANADAAIADYLEGLLLGKNGDLEGAKRALSRFLQRGDFTHYSAESAKWLLGERQRSCYALLIGIQEYLIAPAIPEAHQNVARFRTLLTTHFGVLPEQITTLTSEQATRPAVLEALQGIVKRLMPDDRLILYFSGHMVYLFNDAREQTLSDVYLLYESNPNTPNKTLSARDFAEALAAHSGKVTLLMDHVGTTLQQEIRGQEHIFLLAGDNLPAPSVVPNTRTDGETGTPLGEFIYHLNNAVKEMPPEAVTGDAVITAFEHYGEEEADGMEFALAPILEGDSTIPLFTRLPEQPATAKFHHYYEQVRAQLHEAGVFNRFYKGVAQQNVWNTIERLKSFITQRAQVNDTYPEGQLHLGVAYSALGYYGEARQALQLASNEYEEPSGFMQEQQRDTNAAIYRDESLFQLGRVLLEGIGDYDGAVSKLREVTRRDPTNAQAWYYFGTAIRQQIERQAANEAAIALQTYLELGAPLGQEDEVRKYLTR